MLKSITPNTESWCSESMLRQCINIKALQNFMEENIFSDKFSYCLCMDFFSFGMDEIFSSFKRFLQKK